MAALSAPPCSSSTRRSRLTSSSQRRFLWEGASSFGGSTLRRGHPRATETVSHSAPTPSRKRLRERSSGWIKDKGQRFRQGPWPKPPDCLSNRIRAGLMVAWEYGSPAAGRGSRRHRASYPRYGPISNHFASGHQPTAIGGEKGGEGVLLPVAGNLSFPGAEGGLQGPWVVTVCGSPCSQRSFPVQVEEER